MAEERKVQLGFAVDATGARQGFQEVKDASREMAQGVQQSAQQAGKAIDGMGDGGGQAAQKVDGVTRSIIGSIQRTTAVQKAGEKGTADYYEALAGVRGANTDILRPYLDELRKVEAAQKGATVALAGGTASMDKMGVSAGQTKAALRQLPAQFTDIITSLQGGQKPLTVLIQQGGQIKDAFGGIGETFRALGGQAALMFPALAAAMGGVAEQQQAVAESAGAAATGMTDVAAGANDAAEATKHAGEALHGARAAAAAASSTFLFAIAGFATLAAVAAAVGAAYYQGSKEADNFRMAIITTGNASGVTTSQLREYARQIDAIVGTQAQAAEGLAAFTAAGISGGEEMRRYTQTAIEWERATGQAVDKTAEKFASLQKDPLTSVLKLNEGTNFLTLSVYEQIKALAEQGRNADASKIAMDALDTAMRERAQAISGSLGYIERAWKGIKGAAKEGWDAMLNVGREATIGDKIAEAQAKLDEKLNVPLRVDNPDMRASREKGIAFLRAEIAALQEKEKAENAAAAAAEEHSNQLQARAEWDKVGEKYLSKKVQMERELAKAREAGKEAGASAVEIEQRLAEIRKKFHEKPSSGAAPAGESELAAMRAKTAAARDYLKALQANGLAADKQNEFEAQASRLQKELEGGIKGVARANKEKALAEALAGAEVQKSIDAQKVLLKAQADFENARDKEAMASAAEIQKINAKAQALEDEAAAYGKTASELEALTIQRLQSNKADIALFDNAAERIAQLDDEIAATVRLGNARTEIANLKLGSGADEALRAAQAQYTASQDEYRLAGLTAAQRKLITEQRKITLDYAKKIAEVDKSGADEAAKAAARAKLSQAEQIDMAAAASQAQNEAWSSMWQSVDQTAHDVFVNVADEGMDAFKRIGKTLKSAVLDMLYQMTIKKWIFQIAGMGGGSGGVAQALIGGGNGGSGVVGMASNAYSGYSAGSQAFTLGSQYMSGTMSGANVLGTAYGNATMTGIDGLLATNGAYGTSAAGGGGSAAGGASTGMGAVGAAAALVMLVANAGGFFASDRIVGDGLYGKLGGDDDLTAYNLRREGGTLFNGPEYSVEDPLKEMREAERRIALVQSKIADGTFGQSKEDRDPSGALYSIAFEQQKLEKLKLLYGGQVDAAKVQSDAITKTYDTLRTGVGDMADSLGLGSEAVRKYTTTLGTDKIHADNAELGLKFEGLNQEQIAAKINEALSTASNEMAETLIGSWASVTDVLQRIEQGDASNEGMVEAYFRSSEITSTKMVYTASEYARSGERAIDTLTRLAGSLTTVNGTFDALGVTMLEASLAGGDAASKIMDAFGGAEAFSASTGAFYENYYSEAERMAKSAELLGKEFAKAGVEMPATKDAYRAMVTAALNGGEASAELAAKLLKLGPAFAQVTDYAAALLESAGISGETIASTLRDAMLGRMAASDAGAQIADMVTGGIYNAIAGGLAQQLTDLLTSSLITPVVQAAVAGSSISEAVSQSAIDNMVSQARAAADALGTIFSDPAFRDAISQVGDAIASVTQTASSVSFQPYTTSGGGGGGGGGGSEAAKSTWQDLLADIVRQTRDAGRQLNELGMTSYETALAAITRKGQESYDKLKEGGYIGDVPKEIQDWIDAETRLLNARNKATADKTMAGIAKEIEQMGMTDLQKELASITDRADEYIASLQDLGQGTSANIAAVQEWAQVMTDAANTAAAATRQQSFTDAYQSQLGRAPDTAGLEYWIGVVQSGTMTLEAALAAFGEGATTENLSNRILELTDAEGYLAQMRANELSLLSPANQLLQKRIWALEDESTALAELTRTTDDAFAALERAVGAQRDLLSETIKDLQAVFDMTRGAARDLYGEVESANQQSAAAGQAFIDNALNNARATGYMPDSDELRLAIEGVRKGIAQQQGASTFESERDRLVLAGKLTDLKDIAEPQLTEAQRQLAALEEMLKTARTQIDELRGINTSVLSVADAMTALAAAIGAERAGASGGGGGGIAGGGGGGAAGGPVLTNAERAIASLYQSVLGREADSTGLQWYLDNYSKDGNLTVNGHEFENILRAGALNEDKLKLPGFATGINVVPYDMTARIHEGEAIVPAQFNPFNPGAQFGGGNAEMVAELRALRAEVAALRAAGERTANNTAQMPQLAEQFDNVTEGGSAIRSEVMA